MARILVADDEQGILELMQRVLERRGHEVETYPDGESAVEAVEAAEYDLIVTDLRMPKRTGLDLLAAAKRRRPTVPVILLSGSVEDDDRARAEALGVYMVLSKPVDLAFLTTIIDGAIGRPAAAAPRVSTQPTGAEEGQALVRILERDPSVASLLAYCLSHQGFRAALGPAERPASVVIVGELDDVEAARRESPSATIIALYGPSEFDRAVRALDRGADVAVARPLEPELLFAHVRAAARRRSEAAHAAEAENRTARVLELPLDGPAARNRIAAVKVTG